MIQDEKKSHRPNSTVARNAVWLRHHHQDEKDLHASLPTPPSLKEIAYPCYPIKRATERAVKELEYVTNESGALNIGEMAHQKKLELTVTQNIEGLLLWKAEVDCSLKASKDLSFKIFETSKVHRLKVSGNFKTIQEGDGASHLGSAAEVAQIYFNGRIEDGQVYAQ